MLLVAIIAFLISLVTLLIVCANYSWFVKNTGVFGHVLLFFIGWKILAYYAATPILDIANNFKYWNLYRINEFEYVILYIIELISTVIFIFTLKAILPKLSFKKTSFNEKLLVKLLLLLTILYNTSSIIEDFSFGTISNKLDFLKNLCQYLGQPLAIIGLYYFNKMDKLSKLLIFFSLLTTLLMVNTRGFVIYGILTFLSIYLYNNKWRFKQKHIIYGSTVIFIYAILVGGFPQLSISPDRTESSNRGNIIIEGFDNESKLSGRSFFEEIDFRFGMMPRMSTKFISLYIKGDGAGLNPIINSTMGIVPRSIWPDKPHPSTSNGKHLYSQGMYKIYSEGIGGASTNMVEFSSAGHMFWELGMLGVLIFPVFSAIYISLIIKFFGSKSKYLSIAILICSFKPWGFMEPKIWLSDIPLQIYQIGFPLFIIYLIIKFWSIIRN